MLAVLLIGGAIVWFFNSRDVSAPSPTATVPAAALSLESHKFEYLGGGTSHITGTVKNPSANKFSIVVVRFNVYDSSGNQVGDTLATVNNLEPFKDWKFEALVAQTTARSCKFQGIEAVQ